MMKSLFRILFMLFAFFLSIEVVWFSCDTYQRQQLLESLGRDDLAREVQLDPYFPIMPQLWRMRLEDHQRVVDDLESERQIDRQSTQQIRTQENSTTHSSENAVMEGEEGNNWLAKGKHYAAKMLCHKPKTQSIDNVSKQKIYKWVDEEGRTHFGEKPNTAQKKSSVEDLSKQYQALQQAVQLKIEYPNWAGDSFIESELKKQGKMVHKVLSHYVPKSHLRQINLKIILFKNVAEFQQHRDKQQANAQWGAYYSSASNSIYLPRYPNIEQTMAIARHEMSHAMIAGMLGPIPVWMNEGLAEYMESFSWKMNVAVAQPRVHNYNQLKNANMAELANASYKDFYGFDQDRNYLQAVASIYFLLDHQSGRDWLKSSFRFYAQNPCSNQGAERLFAQTYPGGLAGASRNFKAWIKKGKYPTHRY